MLRNPVSLTRSGLLAAAVALTAVAGPGAEATAQQLEGATCGPGYGDLTGDAAVDVTDLQCLVLTTLAHLAGPPAPLPACLAVSEDDVDVNCDGKSSGADIAIVITLALGGELGGAVDGNGDGCVDYCQDVLPCKSAATVTCGSAVPIDTSGAPSEWDGYACAPWEETGNDARYLLSLENDADVSVAISGLVGNADLDVFIISAACSPNDCLASGDNAATATLSAKKKYYVVVDGFDGSSGQATLSVTCKKPCNPADPCAGNTCGVVECGDDAVDCGGCGDGEVCVENQCQVDTGPTCQGFCGVQSEDECWCDDLCFGFGDCCPDVCAACAADYPDQCAPPPETCGDGVCAPDNGEHCGNCADDCGCEDGFDCVANQCEPEAQQCEGSCGAQSPAGCYCDDACFGFGDCCDDVCATCGDLFPTECGLLESCGDGTCDPANGETCSNCVDDCACPEGETCNAGVCSPPAVATCADACGGQAPAGCYCDEACFGFGDCCADVCTECVDSFPSFCAIPGTCGNGVCDAEASESPFNCPADCTNEPDPCGDGVCDPASGETTDTCPADCTGGGSNCCIAQPEGSVGCDTPACATCICAADAFCCDTNWDGICAQAAASSACAASCPCSGGASCGDGVCDAGETPQTCAVDCGPPQTCGDGVCSGQLGESAATCPADCTGGVPSDCCAAKNTPSCSLMPCSQCVCALDAFCCNNSWDSICAGEAQDECAASCQCGGSPGACGNGACEAPLGETAASCPEDCTAAPPVCGDGSCNGGETAASCPADCGGSGGACCAAKDTPGCPNTECETCVCGADPFCCNSSWDNICADEAADVCSAQCQCGGTGTCGDGFCDAAADETPVTCPADCPATGGCGNGSCALEEGELPSTCPADCLGSGDCCAVATTPGCNSAICSDCVCSLDAFCCDTTWDDICVGEAKADCPTECGCAP